MVLGFVGEIGNRRAHCAGAIFSPLFPPFWLVVPTWPKVYRGHLSGAGGPVYRGEIYFFVLEAGKLLRKTNVFGPGPQLLAASGFLDVLKFFVGFFALFRSFSPFFALSNVSELY